MVTMPAYGTNLPRRRKKKHHTQMKQETKKRRRKRKEKLDGCPSLWEEERKGGTDPLALPTTSER